MQRIENPLQVSPATDKASKKFSQMPTCKRGLDRRRRMSRFRPRCCIMKYEPFYFAKRKLQVIPAATTLVALAISIPIPAQTITTFDAPGTGTGAFQGLLAAALLRMEPSWETTLTWAI